MSEGTKIQWCDDTHNFWRGCTKVSAGCTNCYAEVSTPSRTSRAAGVETWGPHGARIRSKDFDAPLRWNNKPWICAACGEANASGLNSSSCLSCRVMGDFRRRRVFSLSLGDWLDKAVPIEWLADMLRVIHECPNLDFLLLTKRPENFDKRMRECALKIPGYVGNTALFWWMRRPSEPPKHIWLGVSIEDQKSADERMFKIPATLQFLSVEPLLESVDLHLDKHPHIDWVIVGGESGPKARRCDVGWIRSVVDQCSAAGVPCFVKQLGSNPWDKSGDAAPGSIRDKKGGDMSEWPEDLRVRQFPKP